MTSTDDPRPTHLPGYGSDALTHPTGLLDDALFRLGHLRSCPVHRRTRDGIRVDDGAYSCRSPADPSALPPDRMARVSAAPEP
ncbi:hypothetical protein [Streptomyces sp. NPDC001770]